MLLKLELFSILFNHLFMLVGILIFGWSVTELMLFYWIEPLVSMLMKGYFKVYIPLRIQQNKALRRYLWRWLGLLFIVIILQIIALYGIIQYNAQCTKPMVWSWDWLILLLFLPIMYAMPIYAQKQQGFMPILENMPIQTKILLSPIQMISTYIILAISLIGLFLTKIIWVWLIFMIIGKMTIELLLFRNIKRKIKA